jgi:hypothetical protein
MKKPIQGHRTRCRGRSRQHGRRRGITIVVALALMSVSLALSYAVLRSQALATQVQSNGNLQARARAAAWTGFAAGLRAMHQSDWTGVNSSTTGRLNTSDSYSVSWTTGDASLTPSNAAYADFPYRVTVTVSGMSIDPLHSGVRATRQIVAVVRLSPRQLMTEPPDWATMRQFTLYQWSSGPAFNVDLPCRVQGALWLQAHLQIGPTYPNPPPAHDQYLSDLAAMAQNGYPDYRPLTGPISIPNHQLDPKTRSLLTGSLGISTTDVPQTTPSNFNYPAPARTYQIYPGGASYTVPRLSGQLNGVTLAPDPIANPLGIYYASGDLSLQNNVSVQGTLIADGTVSVDGLNVNLQPLNLPPLVGGNVPVQLPTVVAGNNFQVSPFSYGKAQGLVTAFNTFLILSGSQLSMFDLQGQVIASAFTIQPRWEWQMADPVWNAWWQNFNSQQGGNKGNGKGNQGQQGTAYFPVYLQQQTWLTNTPLLTIEPATSQVMYHWKNAADPVYMPATGDPGLRWDLLSVVTR